MWLRRSLLTILALGLVACHTPTDGDPGQPPSIGTANGSTATSSS